ncbi:hypothetical protein QX776_05135 [Alteromonadaceae bacterium BrNp21-10]|nr:hypothetical protein [Alteromonadaceae bacterium BrNp21-10]
MTEAEFKQKVGAFKYYAICIVAVAVCIFLGFKLGNVADKQQQQQIQGMQGSIDKFNSENNALVRKLNILGVELEVEKRANAKAQNDIQAMYEENQQVRKELSFYQKVMAPELNENGFVIDSFSLENTSVDNRFRYSLVLMQQEKRKNFVKGDLSLSVQGSLNGSMQTLDMLPLIRPERENLAFHFRYFEIIQGEVTLPEGFVPEKIGVLAKLTSVGSKNAEHQRSFDWVITPPQT